MSRRWIACGVLSWWQLDGVWLVHSEASAALMCLNGVQAAALTLIEAGSVTESDLLAQLFDTASDGDRADGVVRLAALLEELEQVGLVLRTPP